MINNGKKELSLGRKPSIKGLLGSARALGNLPGAGSFLPLLKKDFRSTIEERVGV